MFHHDSFSAVSFSASSWLRSFIASSLGRMFRVFVQDSTQRITVQDNPITIRTKP